MKLKFKKQDCQTRAVDVVMDCFKGTGVRRVKS